MKNAVKIIAALSLLLGLSLGQIHRQYQELEILTGRTHHFVPQPRIEFPRPMGERQNAEAEIQREIRQIERRCKDLKRRLRQEVHSIHEIQPSEYRIVIQK